jgi:uncharacterized protein DUF4157
VGRGPARTRTLAQSRRSDGPAVPQAKLAFGAPGDRSEQEADRVADQLTRGGGPISVGFASVPTFSPAPSHAFPSRGGGQTLPPAARAYFEHRLGHNFGDVRVHRDEGAQATAAGLRARALTVGRDIYFNAGEFAPGTQRGDRLLGHELTHVVQQRHGEPRVQRAPEDQADSPEQMRLPPHGVNPEAGPPRTAMEEAKLAFATGHQVITFILGPDSDRFYKAAHEYWKQPGRTNVLVTNQRTLAGVIAYLKGNLAPNHRSWGQINLVTHANEEGGMGIHFDTRSPNNLSPEELQNKVNSGGIQALPHDVVDQQTAINVHGCAIGRNPEMLKLLSEAFGGNESNADAVKPRVYAPRDLQTYSYSTGRYIRGGRSVVEEVTDEYPTEYWQVGFPAKEKWSDKRVVEEFGRVHGKGPGIDWKKAAPNATHKTMPYHYTVTNTNYTLVPKPGDRAGHQRLLRRSAPGELASWTRWSVQSQNTAIAGDVESTTITYAIEFKDRQGVKQTGTFEIRLENPRTPLTRAAQADYLREKLGADKFGRFSWDFTLTMHLRPGDAGNVQLRCEGKRSIVRVERAMMDPAGGHAHPSREDPAHYGTYKP